VSVDDNDDAPVRKPRPTIELTEEDINPAPKTRRVVRGGWDGVDSVKTESTEYAVRLKLTEDTQIIKFIKDAPYASYGQHWLERSGQKSFVCLGAGCPLCAAGNRPSKRTAFNVVLLSGDEEPVLRSLEVGVRVVDQLKNFHNSERTGPINKHYWAISRTGKGATSSTLLQMVRERDLEEWGLSSLDEAALTHFNKIAYTEDIIQVPTRADLLRIATEELGFDNE
jgi:hypothetical protein